MKLWGGRFEKGTDRIVEEFNASISIDSRMYKQDINGSIAHAKMLGKCGIVDMGEAEIIIAGLLEILNDIEAGKVEFTIEDEDIHMNIERLLIAKIGDIGKKLHTARSRNDQVALDFRMYTKDTIQQVITLLIDLEKTIINKAEENISTIFPGYTHLQKAQPITLSHHFMAYFEMFKRDMERFKDCLKRVDIMPLGSCALAGTSYPLDRYMVADELGFADIAANSIDAVSDRDFAIEFASCCSILMMHLSRFCEEIIIWNSSEFGFIEMDDAYSTGSSIMPQKKNPDVAELIRGKTGRVYGDLITLLTIMKALPLAYNKDMQEDKEAVFDAADTVIACLKVFAPMLSTMRFKDEGIKKSLKDGFLNATDIADYLVNKGVAFRDAHAAVGSMVGYCIKQRKALEDLSIEEFHIFFGGIEADIYDYIELSSCVKRKSIVGGPSQKIVAEAIKKAKAYIDTL